MVEFVESVGSTPVKSAAPLLNPGDAGPAAQNSTGQGHPQTILNERDKQRAQRTAFRQRNERKGYSLGLCVSRVNPSEFRGAPSPYPLDRHQVRDHLELGVPGHQNR